MPVNGEFNVMTWLLEVFFFKSAKFSEPCEKTHPGSRRKFVAELGLSPDPLNPICALTTRRARFNSCLNMNLEWESPCAKEWNVANALLPGIHWVLCYSGQLFETNIPTNPQNTLNLGKSFLFPVLILSDRVFSCALQRRAGLEPVRKTFSMDFYII